KNYQPDSQRTLYVDDHASRYRYQDNPRGNYQGSGEQGTRTHRSTRSALPSTQYTNFYAGPKASSGILARLPVIIFAAILIAVIIFVIVFLLNNRPEGTTNNTPPNVVINDPGSSGTAVIKVPPQRVVFKFEVVDEALAWVNIYIDGNMVESDYATDITKRTYDVTGVLRFETPRPNAVRVYADGVELDLERDSEDGWMFSVTVSYPEALAKWHLENPPDPQPTGNTEGNN
ncbi:MAG: hypothetical protein FWE65_02870, partial [Eggerthellaceae bacterium]|nr:hypothetical protein [Eggerthellaceae bacterium]